MCVTKRYPRSSVWGWAALALGLAACGSEQDVDDGTPTLTAKTTRVTYLGASQEIDLSTLGTVDVGGVVVVRLGEVLSTALPEVSLATVGANFLSSDGFNPSSKENCALLLPVVGATLNQGYLDPSTRNLSWDVTLAYPGCLAVRDLAEILVETL